MLAPLTPAQPSLLPSAVCGSFFLPPLLLQPPPLAQPTGPLIPLWGPCWNLLTPAVAFTTQAQGCRVLGRHFVSLFGIFISALLSLLGHLPSVFIAQSTFVIGDWDLIPFLFYS